jgi:hypothetical protein
MVSVMDLFELLLLSDTRFLILTLFVCVCMFCSLHLLVLIYNWPLGAE